MPAALRRGVEVLQAPFDLDEDDLDGDLLAQAQPFAQSLIAGVQEASSVLALDSARASADQYFALLRLGEKGAGGGRRKGVQNSYHVSMLPEVVRAVEISHASDTYFGHASFASARSRCVSNVRQIQVAWVDVDCYNMGLPATPEVLERLTERAAFCGIPRPSHVVRSGRGFYLKWLLAQPVAAEDLPAWNALQKRLSLIFTDLGADFGAMDAARVLRVVGSYNSKVLGDAAQRAQERPSDAAQVRVVWNSGLRHTFASLCEAVSLIDVEATRSLVAIRSKALHKAVEREALNQLCRPGDLAVLTRYGAVREPRLVQSAGSTGAPSGWGKSGFTGRTLAWSRFLDLRDVMIARARTRGQGGIAAGSRDLAMFWMTTFLASSGVVRSGNLEQEVREILPAFDGAGDYGQHGFNPLLTGDLQSLIERVAARDRGEKVTFKGRTWDPVYTPSNDLLINVFGITDAEMVGLRTIISSSIKQDRADAKEPGRAQRRDERKAWQAQALEIRSAVTSEPSQPESQQSPSCSPDSSATKAAPSVVTVVAKKLGVQAETIRKFFARHDAKVALNADRAAGKAAPKAYRRVDQVSPEEAAKRKARNERARWNAKVRQLKAQGINVSGLDEKAIQAVIEQRGQHAAQTLANQAAQLREDERRREAESKTRLAEQVARLKGQYGLLATHAEDAPAPAQTSAPAPATTQAELSQPAQDFTAALPRSPASDPGPAARSAPQPGHMPGVVQPVPFFSSKFDRNTLCCAQNQARHGRFALVRGPPGQL